MSRKHPKTAFIGAHMSMVEVEALRGQTTECGLTMSELVRRRVTGQPVSSRADQETAGTIDRLGHMLKYLYPKDKRWAGPDERKRRWSIVTEFERTAKALSR